jgi:hypothetical protein
MKTSSGREGSGLDAQHRGRAEAEARVVRRVARYQHERLAALVGTPERLADELASDSAPLVPRVDAHRAQLEDTPRAEVHVAQHHVADELPVGLRNERELGHEPIGSADRVDDAGLALLPERSRRHLRDGLPVGRRLRAI